MSNQSKYCYPGTDVLINKFDIRDEQKLEDVALGFSTRRMFQLQQKPIKGRFDVKHLQKIHYHIFQDVYLFAGQFRTENIMKGYFQFSQAQFLEDNAQELFSKLKKDKFLSNLGVKQFSEKAAYYFAELNVLHPFREGNGRTQREFIRELGMKNGYNIDWSKVDKDYFLAVSIKSVANEKPLAAALEQCITSSKPNPSLQRYYRRTENELER